MTQHAFLPRHKFDDLLAQLRQSGYRTLGPVLRDGAIVYTDIAAVEDLPAGVTVNAQPGAFRATPGDSPRLFAWANGPQALKPVVFKPVETLWQAQPGAGGELEFSAAVPIDEPVAVLGARACDLAALKLQDRHFLNGEYRDPCYMQRRRQLFLVAVNCTHPASTCFCASTGDGPGASRGYDLLLDELDDGFIVAAGSDRGAQIAAALCLQDATDAQRREADEAVQRAAAQQTRSIPPGDLHDPLLARRDHGRWLEVAERCLACGNCTQVCPTCFCNSEHDENFLDRDGSVHVRQWDSCFTAGHSYIHGMVIRSETRHRYRQWLTHKLGSWHRQYGRSGCVGCGRCIVWCPVGIDITEEVRAVLENIDDF
ncbi:MAG: 4Fe-4S dicluster domain-containing protein [Thiogranum sp.]|nr:4Fe-4S dicluster domain-containing protein [Thiogranum sp.]